MISYVLVVQSLISSTGSWKVKIHLDSRSLRYNAAGRCMLSTCSLLHKCYL